MLTAACAIRQGDAPNAMRRSAAEALSNNPRQATSAFRSPGAALHKQRDIIAERYRRGRGSGRHQQHHRILHLSAATDTTRYFPSPPPPSTLRHCNANHQPAAAWSCKLELLRVVFRLHMLTAPLDPPTRTFRPSHPPIYDAPPRITTAVPAPPSMYSPR